MKQIVSFWRPQPANRKPWPHPLRWRQPTVCGLRLADALIDGGVFSRGRSVYSTNHAPDPVQRLRLLTRKPQTASRNAVSYPSHRLQRTACGLRFADVFVKHSGVDHRPS